MNRRRIFGLMRGGWGPGTSWSPLDLPNLVFYAPLSAAYSEWYTTSAGTTLVSANGDPIGKITDESGSGNDLLQATDANRPIFNVVGTSRSVSFNGTSQYIVSANFAAAIPQPVTVAIAWQLSGISVNQNIFDGLTGARCALLSSTGDTNFSMYASGASRAQISGLPRDTNQHIGVFCYNAASSTAYVDGSARTLSVNPGTNGLGRLVVGAAFDGSAKLAGSISSAMPIVIAGTLSDADRDKLYAWLAARIGA